MSEEKLTSEELYQVWLETIESANWHEYAVAEEKKSLRKVSILLLIGQIIGVIGISALVQGLAAAVPVLFFVSLLLLCIPEAFRNRNRNFHLASMRYAEALLEERDGSQAYGFSVVDTIIKSDKANDKALMEELLVENLSLRKALGLPDDTNGSVH